VPSSNELAHLLVEGVSNIILQGEAGAELIGTTTLAVLRLESCRNVHLRQITLDYDTHPYTQGRIVAVAPDRTFVEWQADESFPAPTRRNWRDMTPLQVSHLTQ
jgi:hypothetical protein